jgi:catechol 2,3-dioxygenase-like lactoylglutathione lyase family enzyme
MNHNKTGCPAVRGALALFGVLLCVSVGTIANAQILENPLGLKVHHITATVAQMPRAIEWYESVLGFQLAEQGEHGTARFAVLRIPGFEIALLKTPEVDGSPPGAFTAPHWIHIVFSVSDPNRLFHALKSRGVKPYVRGPEPTGAVKSFLIQDSEGNEIEIVGPDYPG